MKLPIYLDNHATTPLDPRVLEAMMPVLTDLFGNAASRDHRFGWQAAEAVEMAREQVARLVGAEPREIVFTSGATESDNLALKGAFEAYRWRGDHVVTTAIEHPAVLDCCRWIERHGGRVTRVAVGGDGRLEPGALAAALEERTILASVMLGNNEIGTLNPLAAIGEVTRARGVLLHCDAAQAAGKVPVDVNALGIDLLSISAHKMYGPKGCGALYVRRRGPRVRLVARIDGGGHERGLRSGTLNVPGIVGLGAACGLAQEALAEEAARCAALRDRLCERILGGLSAVQVNGDREHRLPGNLHLSFAGIDGEALLGALRDVAVSAGSACASADPEPSHVLAALGVPEPLARASLRFGIGRFNTDEEIDTAADRVIEAVRALRAAATVRSGP